MLFARFEVATQADGCSDCDVHCPVPGIYVCIHFLSATFILHACTQFPHKELVKLTCTMIRKLKTWPTIDHTVVKVLLSFTKIINLIQYLLYFTRGNRTPGSRVATGCSSTIAQARYCNTFQLTHIPREDHERSLQSLVPE